MQLNSFESEVFVHVTEKTRTTDNNKMYTSLIAGIFQRPNKYCTNFGINEGVYAEYFRNVKNSKVFFIFFLHPVCAEKFLGGTTGNPLPAKFTSKVTSDISVSCT